MERPSRKWFDGAKHDDALAPIAMPRVISVGPFAASEKRIATLPENIGRLQPAAIGEINSRSAAQEKHEQAVAIRRRAPSPALVVVDRVVWAPSLCAQQVYVRAEMNLIWKGPLVRT